MSFNTKRVSNGKGLHLIYILFLIFFSLSGYCEENIQSMEALCNTIAGDAPLYTMFRKGGDLVKCPFRGPFSFSYSKGGRGQVCEHPPSYLDSCSDNQKMKLKYQACLDVEGSEVESELVRLGRNMTY